MHLIGHVAELWRYPVKSMQGELSDVLHLTAAGVEGDRRYAFESSDAPIGKPLLRAAERSALIPLHSRLDARFPVPTVTTPSGSTWPVDHPELPTRLGLDLGSAGADSAGPSRIRLLHNHARPFTDVRPISLLSLQTVRELSRELKEPVDSRRFRSNILLDLSSDLPFDEDTLGGRTIRIGSTVTLTVLERIPRCRIVALDPTTAAQTPDLLRTLARHHGGRAGIYARATTPGPIHPRDPITLTIP